MFVSREPDGSPDFLYFWDNIWTWIDLGLSFLIPCVLILTGNMLILVHLARRARQRQDLGVAQQKKAITNAVITSPYYIPITDTSFLAI